MSASRCQFDAASETCADCRFYADCWDENLPPAVLAAPRTDAPLKRVTRHRLARREQILRRTS